MSRRDLPSRITGQFSDRSERADIWRALELVVPTDRFLNLGYSPRFRSHLIGSPQARLIDRVADELAALGGSPDQGPLLDVGCGRGGGATRLCSTYGFDVVGLDLVSYNVTTATEYAAEHAAEHATEHAAERASDRNDPPTFLVGDASRLPFHNDTFPTCVAVDSIVYMPAKHDVFAEISRVLEPGGVCVISDLLVSPEVVDTRRGLGPDPSRDSDLRRFADAWDMPPLWTVDRYRTAIDAAGLHVETSVDLSPYSIHRLRKWARLFVSIAEGPLGGIFARVLSRLGLDPEVIFEQVQAAHAVLNDLQHVLVAVRR